MFENEKIEYKKTTNEIYKAMIAISAILNKHQEGIIYFGMKNDGTPFKFQITDSTLRDISRKIFEDIKPQIYPEINVVNINGIDVIEVKFKGNDIPYSADGKYYMRTADENRELNPQELKKIMINKEYEENWEQRLTSLSIDDIDTELLDRFIFQSIQCGRLPNLKYDHKTLLEKLGLLMNGHLNNAGKLLFSNTNPLTLKLAVFATNEKNTFLDIKTIEGNIFLLIERAIRYILDNIRWSVSLDSDGIHRVETPEVPIEAIREAVINSFAHARYDLPIHHEIDIFSNRIAITNPGSFANSFTPIDYANNDLSSVLRNDIIAKTLYLCKNVESFGTGIRKIYSLCEDNNTKIDFSNYENSFTFIFSRVDRNVVTNVVTNVVLNEMEKLVLDMLKKNPYLTAVMISEMLNKSSRTIQRTIESLKNKNLIERIGEKKNGYWKVKF